MYLNLKLFSENVCKMEKNHIIYHQTDEIIEFEIDKIYHLLDLKNKIFERENDEFCFMIDFIKEKCTYELKEKQATFDIMVEESFWNVEKNNIELSYAIETNDEKVKILIELLNKDRQEP